MTAHIRTLVMSLIGPGYLLAQLTCCGCLPPPEKPQPGGSSATHPPQQHSETPPVSVSGKRDATVLPDDNFEEAKKAPFIETDSGLKYRILRQGDGAIPVDR